VLFGKRFPFSPTKTLHLTPLTNNEMEKPLKNVYSSGELIFKAWLVKAGLNVTQDYLQL